MTKVSFFTLGCRANQAETLVLEGLFKCGGFLVVDPSEKADIAVINSCTVTAESEKEARRIILRCVRVNPCVRVAITGCMAQIKKKKLLLWPNVSWVVGNAEKMNLSIIIKKDLNLNRQHVVMGFIKQKPFVLPSFEETGRRVRANLKIQDGCDNFCAYCEVPFARGKPRSRVFEDIVNAAEALAKAHRKEIILTGINTGLYAHEGKNLTDVVRAVEAIPGIERLRLSSVEFDPGLTRLRDLMKPPHKLCRFLHMPVQSGCDRTLKRMGRKYVTADVSNFLKRFLDQIPGVMIGTDIIAGFPGETEKDFQETYSFLEHEPFHLFHVFSYSDRSKPRSRLFKAHVPLTEINRRADALRELGRRKYDAFIRRMLGQEVKVLFEQKKGEDWIGHTDNYVTIKMKKAGYWRNEIVLLKIVGIEADKLIGEPL